MTIFHAQPIESYDYDPATRVLKEAKVEDRGHSKFAASAAARWLQCSRSVTEPPLARRPSGKAADEGSAMHLILAWIFTHKMLGLRPPIPEAVEHNGDLYPVERSLLDCFSLVSDLWNSADEVWSEVQVTPFPSHAKICSGTSDLVTWTEQTAELRVCDFKYGRVFVSEHNNQQLLLYALGAIRHIGKRPRTIHMSILQPRTQWHEKSPLRTWSVGPEKFKAYIRPLLDALERSLKTPDQAEVGGWCKYCDHQPTCPDFLSSMRTVQAADPQQYETLNELGRLRGAFKSWIDSVDDLLKEHLQKGNRLESCKLVQGPGRRRWAVDESILVDTLPDMIRSDAEDGIFTLRSVAQIEKLITPMHRSMFRGLVTRGSPTQVLVDASDPRPAINSGEEFDDAGAEEFRA